MRQRGCVRSACCTLATCWICSRLSWVQTLSHTCKIANLFASVIINCTLSTTTAVFIVITYSRLLFLLKMMLHKTICNDDFQHNTALQCWNNFATIETVLQQCCSAVLRQNSLLQIVPCNTTLRNNWLNWWTFCAVRALILFNCYKRPVSAHIQCTYITVYTVKQTFIKQTSIKQTT